VKISAMSRKNSAASSSIGTTKEATARATN
jgi:hypothetical protein